MGTDATRRIARLAAAICLLLIAAVPAAAGQAPQPQPPAPAPAPPEQPQLPIPAPDQDHGLTGTRAYDRGLFVSRCPRHARRRPTASAGMTSHAGWPPDQCLKMDKRGAGRSHVLIGLNGVHNYLLGGYGNDTIIGGNRGDVIWGDYHPTAKPSTQTAMIFAGNGRNFIYANDTQNIVWTGTNPKTVVHAYNPGTAGEIHCQSAGVIVYLSHASQPHFKLFGCKRISHYSVGY